MAAQGVHAAAHVDAVSTATPSLVSFDPEVVRHGAPGRNGSAASAAMVNRAAWAMARAGGVGSVSGGSGEAEDGEQWSDSGDEWSWQRADNGPGFEPRDGHDACVARPHLACTLVRDARLNTD